MVREIDHSEQTECNKADEKKYELFNPKEKEFISLRLNLTKNYLAEDYKDG